MSESMYSASKTIQGISGLYMQIATLNACKVINDKPEFNRMEKVMVSHLLFTKK